MFALIWVLVLTRAHAVTDHKSQLLLVHMKSRFFAWNFKTM